MPKNRVNEILRTSLSVLLESRGFEKQSALYVRRLDDILHMIEVQRSRWNDLQRQSFTLNCGVYVPGITSAFWNAPEPKQAKLTNCCVNIRVGMLKEPRHDIWWEVSNDDRMEKDAQTRAEIVSIVTESALPFLSRFQTELEIARFLTEERTEADKFVEPRADVTSLVYAGLLWRRLGELNKCSMCIEEAKRRSRKTPLEAVVTAFADRCEC